MTIYCISGLGADRRMFERITFPQGMSVIHLDWLKPAGNETLKDYCFRLSKSIDTSEKFSIIGLSFGGIVATELSEIVRPAQLILISSLSSRNDLPLKFRLLGKLKVHRLVPSVFYRRPTVLTYWLFGARKRHDQNLLSQILKDTPPSFTGWAVDKILKWDRRERPPYVFQIHGTKDKLIPVSHVEADAVIPGGGHLMVYTHAKQVSEFIRKVLEQKDKNEIKE